MNFKNHDKLKIAAQQNFKKLSSFPQGMGVGR